MATAITRREKLDKLEELEESLEDVRTNMEGSYSHVDGVIGDLEARERSGRSTPSKGGLIIELEYIKDDIGSIEYELDKADDIVHELKQLIKNYKAKRKSGKKPSNKGVKK